MDIQSACKAPTRGMEFSRPNCPRCGAVLLLAEQSAFSPTGAIHYAWSCDDCGTEFVTSISVLPPQT